MSKCKICGAPFNISMPLGGIFASPTCRCGAIRKIEREKGCPKCGDKKCILFKHPNGDLIFKCPECDRIWGCERE